MDISDADDRGLFRQLPAKWIQTISRVKGNDPDINTLELSRKFFRAAINLDASVCVRMGYIIGQKTNVRKIS